VKKAIVSVTNDLNSDQRVHKMCTSLQEMGFEVLLVGRKLPTSLPLERPYSTHRMSLLFKKGPAFYAFFNLRLFFFLLFRKADVLVSNDLDTLMANAWAKKWKGANLVYDSHEYFTEVPELVQRPKVQRFWEKIERKYLPKAQAMLTVNESIAQKYRLAYNREVRVVRNMPRFSPLQEVQSKEVLGLPTDKTILIMQGAWINVDRGAEELVQAMQFVNNALLLIIGGGDVFEKLKQLVSELHLGQKVCIKGKIPYEELRHYTANAAIGITLDKPTNLNYKLSLPNKLFDYIHAGCAVLASDLPEVGRVVKENKVGVIVPDHEPKTIANAINALISNAAELERFQKNAKAVAPQLSWQNEEAVLKEVYLPFC